MASVNKTEETEQPDVATASSDCCKQRTSSTSSMPRSSIPIPARILFADTTPKLVVVMVGLPARGKTYIAHKLARYLRWTGVNTVVFNVGSYRRDATGEYRGHDFFRADNEEAQKVRLQCANLALEDIDKWFRDNGGQIAVFDATNTTRERRNSVLEFCQKRNYDVLFVESRCDDPAIVEENVREVKIKSPDYTKMEEYTAISDFRSRIAHYQAQYEPLDLTEDKNLAFIQIHNAGQHFIVNEVHGAVQSKIVYFLMNIRITKHTFYFCRHGESEDNLSGKIGGDSSLTERGREFSKRLAGFIEEERERGNIPRPLRVWTSHLHRTMQTAEHISDALRQPWKALNEIDAGVCEGMTYEEIQSRYPDEFALRDKQKFHFRYQMGESYQDLVARLEPVILELERQSGVLLICHQAVARCLLAYFLDKSSDELPYLDVPLHTVMKLTPVAYGCEVERVPLKVAAVDTYRAKPTNVEVTRTDAEALSTVPDHL